MSSSTISGTPQLSLSTGDVNLTAPSNDTLVFSGSSGSVDVTGVNNFTVSTNFQSGTSPIGGHCMSFSGETFSASVGAYVSFGNGESTINGIVMPYDGQLVALSLCYQVAATDVTATIFQNRVATATTISVTGGNQTNSTFPIGFTFTAGDELNAQLTTVNPISSGVILTFFIRFDA